MNEAYEADATDIAAILRLNSLTVANTDGKTFEAMAEDLFFELDMDRVEEKANVHEDSASQLFAAHAEIYRQLVDYGVLEHGY